jgi:hypothetical protein
VSKWDKPDLPIPKELIEELHKKFLDSMIELFNKNKKDAGYPDAILQIE